ncbi:hypothetical protein ACT4UM_11775, partial [Bacillus sp. SS-TM]
KSFVILFKKAFMQEDAKSVLEPFVSNYVADEKDLFVHHYKQEWDMKWNLFQKVMQQDVMNYYESILFALAETIDVSLYEQSKEQLQKQLVEIEKEIYVI